MSFNRAARILLAGGCCSLVVALHGCGGAASTPASFQGGSGDNPMDGGTVENDGNVMTLNVNADGTAIDEIAITTASGGQERVLFDDTIASDVAVPRSIETEAGNSFSFDRMTSSVQLTTVLPLSSTPTTFSFGGLPDDLPIFTRARNQTLDVGDCSAIRDSVDSFCDFFIANEAASKEQLIQLATDLAQDQVDASLAPFVPGFVSNVINDFFDTLGLVCDAWTEMRDGTVETTAVDPCAS